MFCGWSLELVAEFTEVFVSNWGTGSETAAEDESLMEVEEEEDDEDVTESPCRDFLFTSTPATSKRASLGALVIKGRPASGFKPASIDRGGDNTDAEATSSSILSGDDDDAAAEDDKLSPPFSPLLLLSLLIFDPSAAEVVVEEFDFFWFGRIAGVFAPAVVPSS